MSGADVVIFGAGHAGAHAAMALRTNGFTGTMTMIGRESEPPCERPPLSKETFAREKAFDRLYIRQPQFRGRKHVELKLSAEETVVDPSAKALALSDGSTYTYGKLIWATCVAKSIRGTLDEAEPAE